MLLYLVRHGESIWNMQDRVQGHSNPPLSDNGLAQAEAVGERFGSIAVDCVYTSDLQRARTTAEKIAVSADAELIVDANLREINLGVWEGKNRQEIDAEFDGAYTRWLQDPPSVSIENAETRPQFINRVGLAVSGIIDKHKDDKAVCIVAHGGVITAYLSLLMDTDFDRLLFKMQLGNCGITTVYVNNGKSVILTINDINHLPHPEEVKGLF